MEGARRGRQRFGCPVAECASASPPNAASRISLPDTPQIGAACAVQGFRGRSAEAFSRGSANSRAMSRPIDTLESAAFFSLIGMASLVFARPLVIWHRGLTGIRWGSERGAIIMQRLIGAGALGTGLVLFVAWLRARHG